MSASFSVGIVLQWVIPSEYHVIVLIMLKVFQVDHWLALYLMTYQKKKKMMRYLCERAFCERFKTF